MPEVPAYTGFKGDAAVRDRQMETKPLSGQDLEDMTLIFMKHVQGMIDTIKPLEPLSDLFTEVPNGNGTPKRLYWVDLVLAGELGFAGAEPGAGTTPSLVLGARRQASIAAGRHPCGTLRLLPWHAKHLALPCTQAEACLASPTWGTFTRWSVQASGSGGCHSPWHLGTGLRGPASVTSSSRSRLMQVDRRDVCRLHRGSAPCGREGGAGQGGGAGAAGNPAVDANKGLCRWRYRRPHCHEIHTKGHVCEEAFHVVQVPGIPEDSAPAGEDGGRTGANWAGRAWPHALLP